MLDTLIGKAPIPDPLLRFGIKQLIGGKKKEIRAQFSPDPDQKLTHFANQLRGLPIAIETDKANEQHYEVPYEFYLKVLGKHLKYSCCHWDKATNLDDAEKEMLDLYIERAQIQDGQTIMDLGCGWGSFTLYAAAKFPKSNFVSVSNSSSQKEFIDGEAKKRGLNNIKVITANIVHFEHEPAQFDRIISIEMMEHMKNYNKLFNKLASWLKDDGKMFIHIFTHHQCAYNFEVKDATDWMSKYFFSGGMMPADKLFYHFQDDLKIEDHWKLNGVHYQKTSRAWLEKMDNAKEEILEIFKKTYGEKDAKMWVRYWRIFFMACEELWAYDRGEEWIISHYLFQKKIGNLHVS